MQKYKRRDIENMDNNYNSYRNDEDYQRPRKRVSRDTLRKRQLCALFIIALIVLIIVILFANACSSGKSKKDSNNSTTSTSASDVSTTADPALTTTTTTTTIQLVTEPTNDPNSGFKLSRTTAYYTVGQSEYAAIISEYPAGSSEADEVWETSDPNVATVSNLGMVTAISAGECYITVSTKKDPTKEAMIKIYVSGSLN